MYHIPMFLIGFSAALYCVDSYPSIRSEYDHSMYLDESEKYQLLWTVDHDKGVISFATVVNTTGWIGFGIAKGSAGKMAGSDIVIGYVLPDGTGHLVDRYANGNVLPGRDEQQDYELTGSSEKDGQTVLKFQRQIEACDQNDNSIQLGTTKLIFAYGVDDPNPKDDSSITYHSRSRRGSRSASLLTFAKHTKITEQGDYIDLKMNNFTVPKKDTTYWCTAVKIKRSDIGGGKRHVTKISTIVQPGNEGLVHHLVLYSCGMNLINDSHLGVSFECKSPNMPPEKDVAQCRVASIFYGWAVGGEPLVLPEIAGMPIGEEEDTYFLFEMHYDNPELKEGMTDNSAVRLHYTDDLRRHDAGILAAGTSYNKYIVIPPGQKNWTENAYCYPMCTENLNNINVFAALPHMHTTGAALVTRHVRNGKELKEIIRDDNYDFNYQQAHLLQKEIVIKGGDSVIIECTYNSEKRKTVTYGGLSTQEEMCLSYLFYYPKTEVVQCGSNNFHIGMNFSSKYAKKENGKFDWSNVKWTDEMTEELKPYGKVQTLNAVCRFNTGFRNESVSIEVLPKTVIRDPLPSPQSRCQSETGSGSPPFRTTILSVFVSLITLLMSSVLLE